MIDPITLQVMIGGLRAACEEMGAALIRAAYSPNIKERRDARARCSTRRRDGRCRPSTSPSTSERCRPPSPPSCTARTARPGSFILNDPFTGGTHLPRHHAELHPRLLQTASSSPWRPRAPITPSRWPDPRLDAGLLRRLDEEGVVIPPTRVTPEALDGLVARMRNPRQRLADLRAQQSANRVGRLRLAELAARHGAAGLREGMDEILAYSERRTRAALAALPDGDLRRRGVPRRRLPRRLRARHRPPRHRERSPARPCASTSPAPTRRSTATSTARSR